MRKIKLPLILLLSVFFLPFSLYAQSGRKTTTEPKPGKTEPAKPADTNEEVRQSTVSPDGETVEGDVIRFDTSLVTVPVTVLDRNGRYVPQLRRENFRIYENGVEQKIAYFATTDSPFSVVLLIDTSGSTQWRLDDIQDAAINFVGKLKPSDSVMVMSFDDRIKVECKATTDRNVITKAIRRTRTGGGTRLYDAVEDILKKQLKTIPGRKAVVLFTDGVDTTSHRASYESTMRLAEESDAPIYSVDYDTSGLGTGGVHAPGLPSGRGTIFGIPIPTPGIPGSTPAEQCPVITEGPSATFMHFQTRPVAGSTAAIPFSESRKRLPGSLKKLGRQYSLGYYPAKAGKRWRTTTDKSEND